MRSKMLAQMPYCCGVMFLESSSVKTSPVIMLVIWAAKIIKPEYWSLIVFFDKWWSRFGCRWEGFGFVGAGSGTRTRVAPKGHWLSRPAH